MIAADQSGGSAATTSDATVAASALPLGDALTLLAALCYSAACVRLPAWAVQRGVRPLELALGKAAFLTAVALAALGFQIASGQPVAQLWPGWQRPEGWALVLWAALGPGALASVLHVKVSKVAAPASVAWGCLTTPGACRFGWTGARLSYMRMVMLSALPRQLCAPPSLPLPPLALRWHARYPRVILIVGHVRLLIAQPSASLLHAGPVFGAPHGGADCVLQRASLVGPARGRRAAWGGSEQCHAAGRRSRCSSRAGGSSACGWRAAQQHRGTVTHSQLQQQQHSGPTTAKHDGQAQGFTAGPCIYLGRKCARRRKKWCTKVEGARHTGRAAVQEGRRIQGRGRAHEAV